LTVFIGPCYRACNGHGWCQLNSCRYWQIELERETVCVSISFRRCDPGFSGDFCEISNTTLFNRGSFLMDNQTDLMTYQGRSPIFSILLILFLSGGRLSYKCDIISQGKALVFSKVGFRFLRISNINGSSPK